MYLSEEEYVYQCFYLLEGFALQNGGGFLLHLPPVLYMCSKQLGPACMLREVTLQIPK